MDENKAKSVWLSFGEEGIVREVNDTVDGKAGVVVEKKFLKKIVMFHDKNKVII